MKHKNAILTLIIYITNMFAYSIIYKIFLPTEEVITEELTHAAKNVAFATTTIIATILVIIVNRKLLGQHYKIASNHKKTVIKFIGFGSLILFALTCINQVLHGAFHMMDSHSIHLSGTVVGYVLSFLFIICLPILEETFYKETIYNTIHKLGIPYLSLLSAVIFGVIHGLTGLINPNYLMPALVFYTLLGVKFGYLYKKTHTMWTSIFVGITLNIFWFIMINFFNFVIH